MTTIPPEDFTQGTPAAAENRKPEGFESPGLPVDRSNTTGRDPLGDPELVPDPSEVEVPDELRQLIETLVAKYPDRDNVGMPKSAAIPALWAIQRRYGWCTPEGIREAAAVIRVTPAYLQSVATFYDLFRTEPSGKHQVLVCTNISCWMRGGDELLDAFCEATGADREEAAHGGAVSADGEILVTGFECLGACDLAPMVSVNERYYGPLEPADAEQIVAQLHGGQDVIPEKALEARGLAGGDDVEEDPRVKAGKGPNR
ncbi:MAG: NAD(P)H-dependent oxidoreductase subunit E [Solirubrobacterales bacterium]|nr:NAD(P)H-dependent oxidoreductase subunit E [Solirubrobacterales bacterium]